MCSRHEQQGGFSLVELVVGLVVTAIALTLLVSLFFSNAGRSVDPMLQIRAASFGQAIMDEILSKAFDELTPIGGMPACNPCSANLVAEESDRSEYDDVDDYNSYCTRQPVEDSLGTTVAELINYEMQICVVYDSDYDGVDDGAGGENNPRAKLITVDIYPPDGAGLGDAAISFSAYRGNF